MFELNSARRRKSSSESETSGREHLSLAELEQAGEMAVLHAWPEEQEHMISPIPLQPESDLSIYFSFFFLLNAVSTW